MKKPLLTLAALACVAFTPVAPLSAADVFSEMVSVRTTFEARPDIRGLTIQEGSEGRELEFRPVSSESSVLVYGPTKETQLMTADGASVEFLVTGRGSVGIYLRGKPDLDTKGAYLVLVNVGANRTGQIRLFKHTVWPQTAPDNDLIAAQDIRPFPTETWYRLDFKVTNSENGTAILQATLTDASSGDQVATMEMPDPDEALTKEGLVALRLFSEKKTEGSITLRKLTLATP